MVGDTLGHKRCPLCKEHQPTTEYRKDRRKDDGLSDYCKTCCNIAVNKAMNKDPYWSVFRLKKNGAKSRGVPFALEFSKMSWPTDCPVLGLKFAYGYGSGKGRTLDNSPSFDRIDPTKGYIPGNVIIVSHLANRIKNNATVEQLERVAAFYRQLIPHAGASNATEDTELVPVPVD